MPESFDDVFNIFIIIFPASYPKVTWHLAQNFPQSGYLIYIDEWKTQ